MIIYLFYKLIYIKKCFKEIINKRGLLEKTNELPIYAFNLKTFCNKESKE